MPTATRKLCVCDDCSQSEDDHPQHPGQKVKGLYLSRPTWKAHQTAQRLVEATKQAQRISDATLFQALSDLPPGSLPEPVKLKPLPIIADNIQTPPTDNTDDKGGVENLGAHKVARDAKDLTHLGRTIDQRLTAFESTTIQGLQFLSDPLPDTPYISQFIPSSLESRTPYGLKSRHAANAILINFEAWLIRMLQILKDIECHGENPLLRLKESFVEKITNALRDVDDIKRREWERQQRSERPPKQETREFTLPLTVDTCKKSCPRVFNMLTLL